LFVGFDYHHHQHNLKNQNAKKTNSKTSNLKHAMFLVKKKLNQSAK
jgi:hypothetical protein